MESHSIKERAFIFHLKDEKELERQERERQEESEEGKEGDRQRQGEKGFSLRGLVSQLPASRTTLASHRPALNLILHISEVGLIARSPGTELRKVRIRDVPRRKHTHVAHTRAQEAEPPRLPFLPLLSLLPGSSTAFAGKLTQGRLLLGLKRIVQTWTL